MHQALFGSNFLPQHASTSFEAMTEDEMFKILRSGKRKKKADVGSDTALGVAPALGAARSCAEHPGRWLKMCRPTTHRLQTMAAQMRPWSFRGRTLIPRVEGLGVEAIPRC